MKNKILIIDDSKEILFAISEFFRIKNWEIYTSLSMEEALKIITTKKLDIIIIDYLMPYINGVLGVKLIRQIDENVPIIALTVEESESIAKDFFEAGANDFSIKPIKLLDLYSRVNVHLQKNKIEENNRDREYYKGISDVTIAIIEEKMKNYKEYIMIEEISKITGLSNQTVNKYMNHLVRLGYVDLKTVYGKIGRPRNEYLWVR